MAVKKGTSRNDRIIGGDDDDHIYGLDGNDRLDGGVGNDDIIAGNGNDVVTCHWEGSDAIDGGNGIDTLDYSKINDIGGNTGLIVTILSKGLEIAKGTEVDSVKRFENIIGTSFDDNVFINLSGYVYGGSGDDVIHNSGGILRGDGGIDTLFGDFSTVLVDKFWLQRGKGADFVTDFKSAQDEIWLDQDDFALGPIVGSSELVTRGSGHAASGSRAQLIFDSSTHELYYDPDGVGTKPAELIADFEFSDAPKWYDFEMI